MIYYIFIDGIGFGKSGPANPFTRFARSVFLPLGGKDAPSSGRLSDMFYAEADAGMGIKGLPQSATGQTSLWTGINAPKTVNRHISGFPTFTLKKIISKYSIVKVLGENGLHSSFLNCYTPRFFEHMKQYPGHLPASTLVQLSGNQPLKTISDLRNGNGIYMDITNEFLRTNGYPEIAKIDPFQAGKNITALRHYDLVLFEYFLTDKAGHEKSMAMAKTAIFNLEAFLTGIIENCHTDDLLVVTSDHGNMENLDTSWHTENPVPAIFYGKGAERMSKRVSDISGIPLLVYEHLGLKVRLNDDF